MRIFVTGASGFIGRATVSCAVARGHDVVALVRSDRAPDPSVRFVRGDVRQPDAWAHELENADAVIHLAASFDDLYSQLSVNVTGTENLLGAMSAAGCRRLVHVSSLSVYDYTTTAEGAVIDETTPIEPNPAGRDPYTETKVVQEELVGRFAASGGLVTIVRPGAVYGPGRLWNGGLASRVVGRWWLAIGPTGRLKLAHVDNCADAIVMSAEQPASAGQTFNVLDDELPSQRKFLAALVQQGLFDGRAVPVPYGLAHGVARSIAAINRRRFEGKAQVPHFLHPERLDASFKSFDYSNRRAKEVLGWVPRRSYVDALDELARQARASTRP